MDFLEHALPILTTLPGWAWVLVAVVLVVVVLWAVVDILSFALVSAVGILLTAFIFFVGWPYAMQFYTWLQHLSQQVPFLSSL